MAIMIRSFLGMLIATLIAASAVPSAQAIEAKPLETPVNRKPRVVITTDPELDDSNSLIRYLLYSADFDTRGLIYASSQFHWKGDGKGTTWFVPGREYDRFGVHLCPCTSWRWDPNERFIDNAVEVYAKAYPQLHVHNRDYPTPQALKSKIRWGNVKFDGEMNKDSPGSDLIKSLLLDHDESPVYLHAWGGQSTIARALKSIEEQYKGTAQWPSVYRRVSRKAVIHPSGDQDDTYAKYIKPNWPDVRYRQLTGGLNLAYGAQSRVSEEDAAYFTAQWTREHISEKGPMGALYRVWGDGKQMVKGDIFDYFGVSGKSNQELAAEGYIVWTPVQRQGSFIAEGDTDTFLNLIDNGLQGYRERSLGGWGGHTLGDSGQDGFSDPYKLMQEITRLPSAGRELPRAPTHLFLQAAQRDFAARLVWATTGEYAAANHPPRIKVRGSRLLSASPGQRVILRVTASDPDGDEVTIRWWRWSEVDTYGGDLTLDSASGPEARVVVPANMQTGQTIQIIAEATDGGQPALTRYERFIVSIN